ncbi:MAG: hypothetical protein J6R13_05100 [Alistipes sp.]|nr:hypothetical protein [Alistipes sp.]
MKKIFSAMICAVVMLASACTQEFNDDAAPVKMKTITMSVSYELPEVFSEDGTRVTLNDLNQLVWEAGDQIKVVYNGSSVATSTPLDASDAAVGQPIKEPAEFSIEIPESATINYAFYFCGSYNGTPSSTRLRIQLAGWTNGAPDYGNNMATGTSLAEVIRQSPASGTVSYNPTNGTGNVTLHNAASFVEVQLTGTEKVWSVAVLSKSQNLRSRYGDINNIASAEPKWAVYQNVERNSEDPSSMGGAICLPSNGAALSGTPTSFYFAMPVVDLPAEDMFILVRAETFCRLYRSKNAHSFKRNRVTRIKSFEAAAPDTDAITYEPLDEQGLSNCYMVAPATTDKYYSFSVQNIDGSTVIWNTKTRNYGVWPLWATKDKLVEDIAVVYGNAAEGRVHFKVPANSGKGSFMLTGGPINSAQMGTNWSWHIWVTDAHAVTYGDPAITVLDRAPGAQWVPTSKEDVVAMTPEQAAQSVGFMYQYGRHNAFPGAKSLNNPAVLNKWGYEGTGGDKGAFVTGTQDVEFYKFTRWQNGFTNYDNPSTAPKASTGVKYYNMQMVQYGGSWASDVTQESINADGTSGNKAYWSTAEKGNQDPCPQGYRVAGLTELERILRELKGDTSLSLYTNHYSPSNKTFSRSAKNTVDTNADGTADAMDAANNAIKYATDVLGSFSDGEVGEQSADAREAALNGNFVWFPHGGFRMMKQAVANAGEHGCLMYSTNYLHDGKSVNTPAVGVIWGVPDFDLTELLKTTYIAMPSHAITGYPNYVLIPYKWATTGENIWTYSTLAGNSIAVRHNNAATAFTINKGGLPAHDALPVRCVKLPAASGQASVAPLTGAQSDANAWN